MNLVKNIVVASQTPVREPQTTAAASPPSDTEAAKLAPASQSATPVVDQAAVKQRAEVAAQSREDQQERLNTALERINEQASSFSPALKFEPDADSGVVIIKVMNRSTGEVIRQLPPEAVVKASEEGTVPALVAETV